jgi:hypothetical protein
VGKHAIEQRKRFFCALLRYRAELGHLLKAPLAISFSAKKIRTRRGFGAIALS